MKPTLMMPNSTSTYEVLGDHTFHCLQSSGNAKWYIAMVDPETKVRIKGMPVGCDITKMKAIQDFYSSYQHILDKQKEQDET